MNTAKLRSRRVVLGSVAVVAALGVGGAVWASAASADIEGGERDRVAAAATDAVPGTAVDVESSDDPGVAYEVDVRQDDGTEVEVSLDDRLAVVGEQEDRDDSDGDDRVLTDDERASAEEAALAAVEGATVADVEASDDPGVAYEVDVRDEQGAEWDVELDADLEVVSTTADG